MIGAPRSLSLVADKNLPAPTVKIEPALQVCPVKAKRHNRALTVFAVIQLKKVAMPVNPNMVKPLVLEILTPILHADFDVENK